MRTSVRAIILYNKGLILIHRVREENGIVKDYYVFPGGGLEGNESYEECLVREIKEELGIEINIKCKLYEIKNIEKNELFFLCEYAGGKIGNGVGPEFTSEEYKGRGKYITEVVPVDELRKINLLPEEICKKWLKEYERYIV